jgi:hypothetical protein
MGGGNTPPFLIYYMTFKEEIELQLVDNKTLSYEILSQLKHKNYYSGMSKKIGDTVLFGMLKEESENGDLSLNLITFHEEELGELYEEDEEFYKVTKISKIPNIKRKEDGGN